MNNPFQHFHMMPYAHQAQNRTLPINEVPARVNAAMEFLMQLTHKTAEKIAVHPMGSANYDGQLLTAAEMEAQASACKLLTQYFNGTMGSDQFETAYRNALSQIAQEEAEERPGRTPCLCVIARGQALAACPMCRGTGEIQGSAKG